MSVSDRIKARIEKVKKEKREAKAIGLGHIQYCLLRALEDGDKYTYQEIVQATGMYSNLPCELRAAHEKSLGAKGLVEEDVVTVDGKDHFTFKATSKGRKLLDSMETRLKKLDEAKKAASKEGKPGKGKKAPKADKAGQTKS